MDQVKRSNELVTSRRLHMEPGGRPVPWAGAPGGL